MGIFAISVAFEVDLFKPKLTLEGLDNHGGHVDRVGEERAEESQSADLKAHTEFGLGVSAGFDQDLVLFVEVEMLEKLFGCWIGAVLAVVFVF